MERWHKVRLERAQVQDIYVTEVTCTDDSFIFTVRGVSDEYEVEIDQNVDLWPPRCSCLDASWRPGILCKHCMLCLRLMGVSESDLEDYCWEPAQYELYEYLCNAPDCVGGYIAKSDDNNKPRLGESAQAMVTRGYDEEKNDALLPALPLYKPMGILFEKAPLGTHEG